MRVLITGASGFIGSHVLDRLVAHGDSVRVLALPETVAQLRHRDRIDVTAGDLADQAALAEAIRGVEVVYHFAALLPMNWMADLMQVNVHGTSNLLRATMDGQVRRFVFSSSTAVYDWAPPMFWPINEQFPRRAHGASRHRFYGLSKIEAENRIFDAHGAYGLEYVVLRPPVVYGPAAPIIATLLEQSRSSPWPVFRYEPLAADMQWVHVSDLAEAALRAGTLPGAANSTINIAGPERFSWSEVHVMVRLLMEGRPHVGAALPQRPADSGYPLRYDISKAQKVLGYSPSMKLREGLAQIVANVEQPSVT